MYVSRARLACGGLREREGWREPGGRGGWITAMFNFLVIYYIICITMLNSTPFVVNALIIALFMINMMLL